MRRNTKKSLKKNKQFGGNKKLNKSYVKQKVNNQEFYNINMNQFEKKEINRRKAIAYIKNEKKGNK